MSTTITPALLRDWPLPVPTQGKESRGHVLVVAGASRTPGAAVLAGQTALRAGAGKLTIGTTAATAAQVGVAVPEALVEPLPETQDGHLDDEAAELVVAKADQANAVVMGPGLLDEHATLRLLRAVVAHLEAPLVLDATASVYLRDEPDACEHLDGRAMLTVNPTELASICGSKRDEVEEDPRTFAAATASRSGVVVLLGGTEKHVTTPDGRSWTYPGGGPGLGVSGSGDVQAGIVAGLLARGAEPAQAAVWAAYVHARAGERLSAQIGVLGHLAHEQPREIPLVLRELA